MFRMPTISETFARNLHRLQKMEDWSDAEVGRRSGVSGRMIGMYKALDAAPSIDKANDIAKAFGYEGWELLMPEFDPDVVKPRTFDKLVRTYLRADEDARKIMEEQSDYIAKRRDKCANDPNGEPQNNSTASR